MRCGGSVGWAAFFEAERFRAPGYPVSDFSDDATWLWTKSAAPSLKAAALSRRESWSQGRTSRGISSDATVYAAGGQCRQAERALIDTARKEEAGLALGVGGVRGGDGPGAGLAGPAFGRSRALDDAGTLTYLHGTISTKRHPVMAPDTPMYLDGLLVDMSLTGGLEPMLGEAHLRTLTILGFPGQTQPGILDALNHQDFAYRWVTRFIALDKTLATKTLTKLRRQWFAKRKSITALLREVLTNEPTQLLDSDADNKVLDADRRCRRWAATMSASAILPPPSP